VGRDQSGRRQRVRLQHQKHRSVQSVIN
jgi:hypothetical protein